MATITVRRVDESVVQRLKARAEINGRSLEAEVRKILGAAVDNDMVVRTRVFRARIEQLQKEITLRGPHIPSEVLIREDRDRNHGRCESWSMPASRPCGLVLNLTWCSHYGGLNRLR